MKRALVVSSLVVLVAATAGWIVLNGQPAGVPKQDEPTQTTKNVQAANPEEHDFFDVDFSRKMIVHHQQAIEMTDALLATSNNPEVRNVASAIKQSQSDAEQQYKTWFDQWDETYTNLSQFPQMDGHDMYPSYPGLVSASEISKLKVAGGAEADKLFVELMLKHHEGGINLSDMSNKLQYKKLIDFKNGIFDSYKNEIDELKGIRI